MKYKCPACDEERKRPVDIISHYWLEHLVNRCPCGQRIGTTIQFHQHISGDVWFFGPEIDVFYNHINDALMGVANEED